MLYVGHGGMNVTPTGLAVCRSQFFDSEQLVPCFCFIDSNREPTVTGIGCRGDTGVLSRVSSVSSDVGRRYSILITSSIPPTSSKFTSPSTSTQTRCRCQPVRHSLPTHLNELHPCRHLRCRYAAPLLDAPVRSTSRPLRRPSDTELFTVLGCRGSSEGE